MTNKLTCTARFLKKEYCNIGWNTSIPQLNISGICFVRTRFPCEYPKMCDSFQVGTLPPGALLRLDRPALTNPMDGARVFGIWQVSGLVVVGRQGSLAESSA